jgi:hypothetical protein
VAGPAADRLDDLFAAMLASRGGAPDQVEVEMIRATSLFRELSMPFYIAVTLLERSEWLVAQHRAEDAEPLLDEAHEIFFQLGAKPWLERTTRVSRARRKSEAVAEPV